MASWPKAEITSGGTISGVGLTISAMLIGRLWRNTGDTWGTNTAGNCPLLLEFDIHIELDAIGSDDELSK